MTPNASEYSSVLEANVLVHSKMAKDYHKEPHFKPENIARTESLLNPLIEKVSAKKALDLGCGTGFMINLLKKNVAEVDGVDATQAMLDQVDKSGPARINLHCSDTAKFDAKPVYDIVTCYSFLHHLYDIAPTMDTASKALKSGGYLYIDLEPNFYFWQGLFELNEKKVSSTILQTEISKLKYQDGEVATQLGVDKALFNKSEYGKNIKGGIKEDDFTELLQSKGFKEITPIYYWYVGQAQTVNDDRISRDAALANAELVDRSLQRILPLSRMLYKYVGFIARKA